MNDSGLRKRSMTVSGHRTSVALEPAFWEALERLARERGCSVQALVAGVDGERGEGSLSSALRLHVLRSLTARLGPAEG